MNRPNTEIKRWGIAVVQSLTSKDKKQEKSYIMMFFDINVIVKKNPILLFIMSLLLKSFILLSRKLKNPC